MVYFLLLTIYNKKILLWLSTKESGDKVGEVMHEMKEGRLKTGTGKKVTSRKQAIAIGLSEAREEGVKAPPLPKKTAAKKASPKKAKAKK